jgi:hypothetical protein
MRKSLLSIGVAVVCVACHASTAFDVAVTNALAHKSRMIQADYMNYLVLCANQATNTEMSLTARVLLGYSQLTKFETSMDEQCLADAYLSVTNILRDIGTSTGNWQYWQSQLLHVACLNSEDKLSQAYLVSSNAWQAIQASGFGDSTNCISRSLLKFEGLPEDSTVKDAVAISLALTAYASRHTNAVEAVKSCLPVRLRSQLRDFLGE